MLFDILKDQKNSIPYRPIIAKEIGVIGAIILQQMIYRFNGDKFYKFTEPCSHDKYKPGDSWTEELGLTTREFTYNLKKIGFKLGKFENVITKEEALIIYYTDSNRLTWYDFNIENIEKLLQKCYQKTEKVDLLSNGQIVSYQVSDKLLDTISIQNNTTNKDNELVSCNNIINKQVDCNNINIKEEASCNNINIKEDVNILSTCNVKEERKKKKEEIFENLWNRYPGSKTAKQSAEKWFNKFIKTDYDISLLRYSLPKYIETVKDKKYLLLLRTYLSEQRYLDYKDQFDGLNKKAIVEEVKEVKEVTEEINKKYTRKYEN